MAEKQLLVGNIDLSLLKGAHTIKEAGGKTSVVIPVEDNPCIFLGAADKGGHIYLDIEVRESPDGKYNQSHFIKVSVNRDRRAGLSGERLRELTPIVGNLRILNVTKRQDEDMPEGM